MATRLIAASIAATALLSVLLLTHDATSQAAGVRVLASNGVKAVLEEIRPKAERAIGHPLTIQFNSSAAQTQRIEAGEAFDVAILTSDVLDDLIKSGKIARATRAGLARTGIGVGVRKGTAKPDIRTPEAIKQTLVNAGSLTYAQDGASRPFIVKMLESLGIAENVRVKTQLFQGSDKSTASVAKGESEIVITLISEILPVQGIELVGPLPAQFQNYVSFAAGIPPNSANAEAGRTLIEFLKGPATAKMFKAKGMEVWK
jgi:molybdate transport system substrate-binding protein